MNQFNKIYNKIKEDLEIDSLYNVPSNLIKQEIDIVTYLSLKRHPYRSLSIASEDVIYEEVYFQSWDVSTSAIEAINNILKQILDKFNKSRDIDDLKFKYPIKNFLNDIDYSTLSNYKNFHKFLDLLKKHAIGSLTITIGQLDEDRKDKNYYQPPYNCDCDELADFLGMQMGANYYSYIKDLTKDCKNWAFKVRKIMKELYSLQDFGTINIAACVMQREEQYIKATIAHELTHFIKFLIRINSLNYKYGLYQSRQKPTSYFLKPEEWKELAATYIEELILIFNQLDIEHTYQNALKFKDAFYYWCKIIPNTNIDLNLFNNLTHILAEHFHHQEIEQFIIDTYNSSKNDKTIRNNWKIFNKWFDNQFKRRYKV